MARKIRNPKFKQESLTKISWTRAVKNTYPCDHSTACCNKRIYPGEIAVTIPTRKDGVLVGTAIVHRRCLANFLVGVPEDAEVIRQRFDSIRKQFIGGKREMPTL